MKLESYLRDPTDFSDRVLDHSTMHERRTRCPSHEVTSFCELPHVNQLLTVISFKPIRRRLLQAASLVDRMGAYLSAQGTNLRIPPPKAASLLQSLCFETSIIYGIDRAGVTLGWNSSYHPWSGMLGAAVIPRPPYTLYLPQVIFFVPNVER
jgi:hypothetical protein